MRHLLLDASALVDFVVKSEEPKVARVKREVAKLVALGYAGKVRLYVPNVCMAECSKALARAAYQTHTQTRATDVYRRYVDALLEIVSSRRSGVICSFDLVRADLEDIEDVFKFEYSLPERDRAGRLSGVDAIVIAMGRRLARLHGDERVLVVTAERGISTVCRGFRPALPAAVNAAAGPVPDA